MPEAGRGFPANSVAAVVVIKKTNHACAKKTVRDYFGLRGWRVPFRELRSGSGYSRHLGLDLFSRRGFQPHHTHTKTTFLLYLSHPSLHRTRTGTGLPSGEECVLGLASALEVSEEIVLKVSEEIVLEVSDEIGDCPRS